MLGINRITYKAQVEASDKYKRAWCALQLLKLEHVIRRLCVKFTFVLKRGRKDERKEDEERNK